MLTEREKYNTHSRSKTFNNSFKNKKSNNKFWDYRICSLQPMTNCKHSNINSPQKDEQLAAKNQQLQQKEAAIAAHQQVIQQHRQQLEKVTAEFQKRLLKREKLT